MIAALTLLLAGCLNYGTAQYPLNIGGQQGTFINPLGAQPQGPVTTNIGFANQPTNVGTALGSSFLAGVNPQAGFGTGFTGGFGAGQGLGPYSAAFLGMRGFGAGAAFNPALLALAGKTLGVGPGLLPQEKEEPRTLTCFRLDKYPGAPTKVMSVTVTEQVEANPYSFLFQGPAKSKGLSMTVEAMLSEVYGAAKIVITERGAVSAGCNAQSLGPSLSLNNGGAQQLSFLGLPYLSPFGKKEKEDGVVATITLLPDRKSAIHVDNLGPSFPDLSSLAGRGLALVSYLDTDQYGRSTIRGEALFCCSLEWDNQPRSLHEEDFSVDITDTKKREDPKGTTERPVVPSKWHNVGDTETSTQSEKYTENYNKHSFINNDFPAYSTQIAQPTQVEDLFTFPKQIAHPATGQKSSITHPFDLHQKQIFPEFAEETDTDALHDDKKVLPSHPGGTQYPELEPKNPPASGHLKDSVYTARNEVDSEHGVFTNKNKAINQDYVDTISSPAAANPKSKWLHENLQGKEHSSATATGASSISFSSHDATPNFPQKDDIFADAPPKGLSDYEEFLRRQVFRVDNSRKWLEESGFSTRTSDVHNSYGR